MKHGTDCEVDLLGHIMPTVTRDIFQPADILNRLLIEFMSGRPRVATSLTRTIFQVIPFSLGQSWPNFLFPLIDISFRMKGFQRCSTGWQTNSSPRVDSFNFVEFYENVI